MSACPAARIVWIVRIWLGRQLSLSPARASAIAHSLLNNALEELAGNDEVIATLYFQWQDDLVGLFQQASHGKRLLRLGYGPTNTNTK